MRALFTLTIFLGSLLLFFVQPLVAKMILPFFGGVSAVWNTSLVFFQAVLLLGYAYAHFGPKLLGPRLHYVLHLGFFGVAILLLPFGIDPSSNPMQSAMPLSIVLLGFLMAVVGLPYFVVSAGAPLLQRWFARTTDPSARDPYFLYAASNVGSMAALLGYPFWIESRFRIAEQASLFKWGFVALGALVAVCGVIANRGVGVKSEAEPTASPEWGRRVRWVLLSAAPTSLLLGLTNYLTTNLASIPLLWVVPLAVYLATYIVAFRAKPLLNSEKWGRWMALFLAPMAMVLVLEATEPFVPLAILHLVVFAVGALMCHSELAESRPSADHLTEFYLWLSLGGVLGGAFNALLAPVLFDSLAEYPLALVAIAALRAKPSEWKWNWREFAVPIGIAVLTVSMWALVQAIKMPANQIRTALTMGLPAILCFITIDRPVRYAASMGAFLFAAILLGISAGGKLVYSERSFFGVHRIIEPTDENFRQLTHGNTIHGRQNLDPAHQATPLTYYYPDGPIGEAIQLYQSFSPAASYGFVGLGVGSMAAYGRPADSITYYEIDPVVVDIAKNPKFFTFLSNCRSKLEIVLGDARLSLSAAPDAAFDMLVLDAFSSDAIPVHLLTKEAFDLYMSKVKPNGVIAIHISNRYLDLGPMLASMAAEKGLAGYYRYDDEFPVEDEKIGRTQAHWVVLAPRAENLEPIRQSPKWSNLNTLDASQSWSDDRSNLLEAWNKD